MFAGMVFYNWTARERWRRDYYADEIRHGVVALLEVPGFRMKGMDLVGNADTSPVAATVGYVLEGQGEFQGVSLCGGQARPGSRAGVSAAAAGRPCCEAPSTVCVRQNWTSRRDTSVPTATVSL